MPRKKPASSTSSKQPATLHDEVETFITKLDKLYYEKPAGYFAYLAVCGSATKLADFTTARPPAAKPGSEPSE
jgi:hypothetical protein